MSNHETDFEGSIVDAIRKAIDEALPDAQAHVEGGGGHYVIDVISNAFSGKSMVQSHRLVYSAVASLMQGDQAPVHAIDRLTTRTP